MQTNTEPLVFNPFDPVVRADPYALYRRMRAEDPVHRSPLGVSVLTRYDDIVPLLRDPRMSSDARHAQGAWFADEPGAADRLQRRSRSMLFQDAPDHTRLRRLVSAAFTPRIVEELAPRVQQIVDELIASFGGDEVDLIESFAYPLPVRIIAELLGVPDGDVPLLRTWSSALARALDPFPAPDLADAIDTAAGAFDTYFAELIATRRAHPRDDLVTSLAAIEEEGDRLSHDELLTMLRLLLIAGHETTMNLIGNGVLALLRAPEQLARVRDEPARANDAVEELLRYDSPVQLTGRIALEPVEVNGTTLDAGTVCLLVIGSANRDPARFAGADTLDVARADNRHLAFGGGPHFCLGAPLARLEARIALPSLLRRFPRLALARDDIEYRENVTLRGLRALPVRLD